MMVTAADVCTEGVELMAATVQRCSLKPVQLQSCDQYSSCRLARCMQTRTCVLRYCRVVEIVKLLRQAAPEAHIVIQGLLPRGAAFVGPKEWKWPNRYTKPLEAVNSAFEVSRYGRANRTRGTRQWLAQAWHLCC